MADRPVRRDVLAGDGTWVENRPTKWQQIRNILSPYVTAPINAMERLVNSPAIQYGFAPTEQDVADSFALSGLVTGGSAFAPKPQNAMTMGIRAYHGSPHSFDKFSTSKIGTGEGAQAYGHGLYFAENEDIARAYRDALKPGKGTLPEDTAARVLELHGGDRDAAMASLTTTINKAFENNTPYEEIQRLMQAKNILNTQPERASGSMYEVNIAADPEAFLDWDKPLSKQPANVREAMAPWAYMDAGGPAGDILRWDMKQGGKLSEYLAQKGIPGIRYLDAGSRVSPAMAAKEIADWKAQLPIAEQELADAIKRNDKWLIGRKQAEVQRVKDGLAQAIKGAEGTRNYVVFDDKLISIVRKYGIAGASAMLGYNILDNISEAQAEELRRIEKTGVKK
jgi:hypothetical protein